MYKQHFGLNELPFGITPDTSFFFSTHGSQEALNTLLIATRTGEGFIKITGEVGTGKTLLCRKFLATLDERMVSAYIPNPMLEPRSLLLALADELALPLARDVDQHQLLKAINHRLLDLARSGKQVILCLDEAQAMPIETLEALRLLTNLETEKRKLLQIVLFGQPELNRKLAMPEIRQLNQRITFHYHLGPLNRHDLDYYIQHRLQVAGFRGGRLFTPAALRILHRASRGVPRLVNVIAHKAMMLAYGQGVSSVGVRQVMLASRDTGSAKTVGRYWWWMLGAFMFVAGSGIGWAYLR